MLPEPMGRRRLPPTIIATLTAVAVLAGLPATPAQAHSCVTADVRLGSFALDGSGSPPVAVNPWFYWKSEGQPAFAIAWFFPWCNDNDTASVPWQTSTGTAGSADYQVPAADSGPFVADNPGYPGNSLTAVPVTKQIDILDDSQVEPAVEKFTVSLVANPSEYHLVTPNQASVYIVDTDGSTRYSTVTPVSSTPVIAENGGTFKFPVFRAGDASTPTSATLTYSGGANGVEFDGPSSVPFDDPNDRFEVATITAKNDADTSNEAITVSVAGGAPYSSLTFTILDDDSVGGDTTPPVTWFHHPKHKKTYKFGALNARTIHVFTPLETVGNPIGPAEPSGIDKVQVALRKKKKGGKCLWWTAARTWKSGLCGAPKWFEVTKKIVPYSVNRGLYYYDLQTNLRRTKGTKIKNYQVRSKGTDGAGNVEKTFQFGRNKNTFWIA